MNYDNIPEVSGFKKIPIGKAKDLRQQKFGKLNPLYRTENDGMFTKWVCQCDCGKVKSFFANSLTTGVTKSCGCWSSTLISEKLSKDFSGQRFGKLIVLYKIKEKSINGRSYYQCQCDCGNQCIARSDWLIDGRCQSCGCVHRDSARRCGQNTALNLLNQRFGKLTVIEKTEKRKWEQVVWKCKCDCGNIVYVATNLLTGNHTTSCGCAHVGSRGEEKIKELLQQFNISYDKEKTFLTCISPETKQHLRYDFYINNQYLLEYDGEQHFYYEENNGWNTKEKYDKLKIRDNIKTQWCKDNNIPLIRIPYTAYNTLCIDDLKLETTKYRVV